MHQQHDTLLFSDKSVPGLLKSLLAIASMASREVQCFTLRLCRRSPSEWAGSGVLAARQFLWDSLIARRSLRAAAMSVGTSAVLHVAISCLEVSACQVRTR